MSNSSMRRSWLASPRKSTGTSSGEGQVPHTGQLPVAQASPARHPRTAAQFLRQHLPRDSAAEDKENAGQTRAIRNARPSAFGSTGWNRQERFDKIPQRIGEQRDGHGRPEY